MPHRQVSPLFNGLIRQLKQDRNRDQNWDWEEWVTVYHVEHFTLQLMWELKWDL